ncbi:PLC-like phosphodiesterase [Exidia glandulosa HHB12029]|uniref:PLC-like phosphodiesterase n=1 Tax=Exidia glandulosa HHB12029 TaxID=1314781 RepID=A0A165H1R3_EXIGL|nr:PLC-like phosphodiesterase [Exidia glandulosa HHB12029]
MSTQNNAQGSTIPLGWVHDGQVSWVLSSNSAGQFTSSRPPPNWMQTNLAQIGNLPLQRLSMPGSHDAGMSRITGGTAFGEACNSLTQTAGIDAQLAAGSRYFDVRPIITAGTYSTGHYTGDAASAGANGQPMSEIISQVNAFTAKYNELVIINLSHSLNTDVGTSDYRAFTQAEWDALFNQLMSLNNRLDSSRLPSGFSASSGDLSTLTLNQLVSGRGAVVLVVQDGANLSSWFGKGIFAYSQFDVFNSYSNTDNLSTMTTDQLNKLVNQHNKVFLLSWTLTQTSVEAALCTKSILDLANTANPALYNTLINSVSPTRNIVPNILYVDNMSNGDIVGLAMAYNFWQSVSAQSLQFSVSRADRVRMYRRVEHCSRISRCLVFVSRDRKWNCDPSSATAAVVRRRLEREATIKCCAMHDSAYVFLHRIFRSEQPFLDDPQYRSQNRKWP